MFRSLGSWHLDRADSLRVLLTCSMLIAGSLAIGSCAAPGSDFPIQAANRQTPEPLLNSERIRQRFGSYGIDVVRESESLRLSNLYSLEGGYKITRTLAVVIYARTIPEVLMAEHREIKSGQSIGEVFGRHGWSIAKETALIGEIPASPAFAGVYASMGGIGEVNLAVHVYRLSVGKNGAWMDFATIAEVHQPDYLGLEQLREINGAAASGLDRRDIQDALDLVSCLMSSLRFRDRTLVIDARETC